MVLISSSFLFCPIDPPAARQREKERERERERERGKTPEACCEIYFGQTFAISSPLFGPRRIERFLFGIRESRLQATNIVDDNNNNIHCRGRGYSTVGPLLSTNQSTTTSLCFANDNGPAIRFLPVTLRVDLTDYLAPLSTQRVAVGLDLEPRARGES